MAENIQVELVSPEQLLASVEAEAVTLPGSDGDFTAMANHVPVATPLRPGRITVRTDGGETDYLIAGGFAEVSNSMVSVLAEYVVERQNATPEMFEKMRENAQEALDASSEENRAEAKRNFDMLNSMIAELSGNS